MMRAHRWAVHALFSVFLLGLSARAAPAVARAAMPESMRDIVLGTRARPVVETELDGVRFLAIAPFSTVPYVLWPAASDSPARPSLVAHDRARAARWILRSAQVLGLQDFELSYQDKFDWHGNEVWAYALARKGIAVHDARVLLYWRGGRFVGMVNAVPRPILRIEEPVASPKPASERLYVCERVVGGYAMVLANAERATAGGGSELSLIAGNRRLRHIVTPAAAQPPVARHALTAAASLIREWPVPVGRFPDMIDTDSTGLVWFSQGLDNWLTSFDPATGVFVQYPSTGADFPDGMVVDSKDVIWTGLYDGTSGLGRFAIATKSFSIHAAPYPNPSMAVPIETLAGTLWVTDHEANRISEYDPASGVWLQSLVLPTATAWVVHGIEDTASGDVYFPEYLVDQLAKKSLTGPVVEIATPAGGGPAIGAYHDGKVYFSQGFYDRLGVYDIATQAVTEFTYPVANELGGPLNVTADGRIAVATRNVGYIMVFNPALSSFASHLIPTPAAGMKDGLRSDASGNVWITESGSNRIAVLDRCAPAGPAPLGGQALFAVKEGSGARIRWTDDPQAEGYEAAHSASRDFSPPLTTLGTLGSGNPGVTDTSPPGPSGLRFYRVATERCGVLSSY